MRWKPLASFMSLGVVTILLLLVAHVSVHATSQVWEVVPSPNGAFADNILYDLHGTATNDVWAVGASGATALIQHWDGNSWELVAAPSGAGTLRGVAALDGANAWAVGNYVDSAETDNWEQTLILHWDGTVWSEVPSPSLGIEASLFGVTAVAPDDVWAVGFYRDFHAQTLTLHWDGTAWSQVPSPNLGDVGNLLSAVSATTADDVWAAGSFDNFREPLLLHWDGAAWNATAGPARIPITSSSISQPCPRARHTLSVGQDIRSSTAAPPTRLRLKIPLSSSGTATAGRRQPARAQANRFRTPGSGTSYTRWQLWTATAGQPASSTTQTRSAMRR